MKLRLNVAEIITPKAPSLTELQNPNPQKIVVLKQINFQNPVSVSTPTGFFDCFWTLLHDFMTL